MRKAEVSNYLRLFLNDTVLREASNWRILAQQVYKSNLVLYKRRSTIQLCYKAALNIYDVQNT